MKTMPMPPYFAVVFASHLRPDAGMDYAAAAHQMERLAAEQEGFLGIESTRGADGTGITVSYWKSMQDIERWRNNAEHRTVQEQGRREWYKNYAMRICKVERAYDWHSEG